MLTTAVTSITGDDRSPVTIFEEVSGQSKVIFIFLEFIFTG